MSAPQSSDLTLDRALKLLKSHDRAQLTKTESSIKPEDLRSSLLLIKNLSLSQNLGICANNFQQGLTALESYLKAFGYQDDWDQNNVSNSSEPVYLKFSTEKMSYYSDKYIGEYRGVLVSFQSEDDLIAGTYGHFPLDLFMNDE